ncbi:hypothetical protein SUGI_0812590 [Cryptomeria japonica]|uniref:heavy metal-associated isoprenylated plant protein 39 n=1 Tax=Cryptomeria japonica TaxID=3369 RepID=UPI002414886C|nr:heavy metal-associated isoprenylated plant protein 39 [Cryptomeria japonica]GLJ39754.1 hypothetical protein SUGI_0812590 [Cryptomeria japonica]
MAYRTVMSVDMDCYKCKRVALQSVTKIDGIDTISINMKERTITVDGDADPVCIANEIKRKFRCARLVSYGPPPPPPKPSKDKEKKGDDKKDDGKKGDEKKDGGKKGDGKKEDGKKDEPTHQIIVCPRYPQCVGYCSCPRPQHCGCHTCSSKSGMTPWPGYLPPRPPANEVWYIWNDENYQRSCTIC